ncbi:MAG TPA: hypothetical protein VMT31_02670 [Methanomicrobiales archaeon]|jgi:hypothetical protein|nr:hypothetical protein [Methanomicrobiales archaeon]
MVVIKKIEMFSLAKMMTLFGLAWGIISGIVRGALFELYAPIMGFVGRLGFSALGGVAVFVLMVIIGIIGGFILGAAIAFLYNVFADWIGGIELGTG